MRLTAIYVRGMKEQIRDVLNFVLTVSITPLFIFLYSIMLSGGGTSYPIAIINHDYGTTATGIIQEIKNMTRDDGTLILKARTDLSELDAEKRILDHDLVLYIVFPQTFTASVNNGAVKSNVILRGDPSHPYYMTCAAMIWNYLETYQLNLGLKAEGPITVTESFAGTAITKTEFENYVPGLLVISVIMLVFIAAVNIARDKENGVFLRYRMSTSPGSVYLVGNLLVFLTMALLAIIASLATAALLGFRFNDSWPGVILILLLSVFPILALGILSGVFVNSAIKAYLISSFPFLFLMFFSGTVFPLPQIVLFSIGNFTVRVFDLIPTYHAVRAMTKLLCFEQSVYQVGGEILAMIILSILFYIPVLFLVRDKLKSGK